METPALGLGGATAYRYRCALGCGGVLKFPARPVKLASDIWPRRVCSQCAGSQRIGQCECLGCGQPLSCCRCTGVAPRRITSLSTRVVQGPSSGPSTARWAASNPRDSCPKAAMATRPDPAQGSKRDLLFVWSAGSGQHRHAAQHHSHIPAPRVWAAGNGGNGKVQRPGRAAKQRATKKKARTPSGQIPGNHGGTPRAQAGGMRTAQDGDKTDKAEEGGTRGGSQPLSQSGVSQNGITATRSRCWSHPPSGRYCQRRR